MRRFLSFLLTRPLRDVTQITGIANLIQIFLLTRPLRDVTKYSYAVIC